MIRIASAALAAMSLASATPSFAASVETPMVVAQNLDVRIGGDRDRYRDRDWDRGRGMREGRVVRERVQEMRGRDCRTVVVRRHTPNGTVTRRTRTCD